MPYRYNPYAESTQNKGANFGYASLGGSGELLLNTASANGKVYFGKLPVDPSYSVICVGQNIISAANSILIAYGGSLGFTAFNGPGVTGTLSFRATNVEQASVTSAGFSAKNFTATVGNFQVATNGDISVTNATGGSFATIILDGAGGTAFRLRRNGVSLHSLFCGFDSATSSTVYNHQTAHSQLRFNADDSVTFYASIVLGALPDASIPNGGIAWSTTDANVLKGRTPAGTLVTLL